MSIKTFLGHIGQAIAHFFESVSGELKNEILPVAIGITNVLKTITTFDQVDLIGSIAGKAGANLEDKLRSILPSVITDLQLAQAFVATSPNADDILNKVLQVVSTASKNVKTAFWIEFSGKVTEALMDGNISIGEGITLAQWFYANQPAADESIPATAEAETAN